MHSTEALILKLFVFELTVTYIQSSVADENYSFTFHCWWLNHQEKKYGSTLLIATLSQS